MSDDLIAILVVVAVVLIVAPGVGVLGAEINDRRLERQRRRHDVARRLDISEVSRKR